MYTETLELPKALTIILSRQQRDQPSVIRNDCVGSVEQSPMTPVLSADYPVTDSGNVEKYSRVYVSFGSQRVDMTRNESRRFGV